MGTSSQQAIQAGGASSGTQEWEWSGMGGIPGSRDPNAYTGWSGQGMTREPSASTSVLLGAGLARKHRSVE